MAVTITEFKAVTEDYFKKVRELEKELGKLSEEEKKAGKEGEEAFKKPLGIIEKLEKKLQDLRKARDRANDPKAIRRFNKEIANTEQSLNKLTKTSKTLGDQVSRVGARLAAAFAIQQVVGNALKTIKEFDESVANLQKTTGLSAASARELATEIIKIDTRTSVTSLLELATAGGRLGLSGQELIKFTEAADKAFVALGDSLEGSAEDIALTLGKLASSFKVEGEFGVGESIERIGSALNALGANSKATEGPIVNFTNRLAGVASQANISITDIAALGALFNSTGQSIEVAATTFNTLLPAIGKDIEKFANVAGVNIEEFRELLEKDAIGALKLVAVGAKSTQGGLVGLTETLQEFGIDSARAASIVGVLADNTDELTRLQKISADAFKENTSLADEFAIKNNTLTASQEKLSKGYDQFILSLDNGDGVISKTLTGLTNLATGFLATVTNINSAESASRQYFEQLKIGTKGLEDFGINQDSANKSIKALEFLVSDVSGKTLPELQKELDLTTRFVKLNKDAIEGNSTVQLLIIEHLKDITKEQEAATKTQKTATQATKEDTEVVKREITTITSLQKELQRLQSTLKNTEIGTAEFRRLTIQVENTKNALKAATGESEKAKTATEKLKDRIAELRDELEAQALTGELNNETLAEFQALVEKADAAQKLLKEAIEGTAGAFEEANKQVSELKKELLDQAVAGDINNETLERLKLLTEQITDSQEELRLALEGPIDNELEKAILLEEVALLKVRGTEEETANERAAIRQRLLDLRIGIIDREIAKEKEGSEAALELERERAGLLAENAAEKREETDKTAENDKQRNEEVLQASIQTSEALADFIGQLNAIRTQKEINELNERRDAALENDNLTADERKRLEEQFEEERVAILTKQAQQDKALNIFNATVAGAAAVIAQLSVPGAGPALAVAAGITAALQIATIIATPIPTFHTGKVDIGNKDDEFNAKLQRGETVTTRKMTAKYKPELTAIHEGKLQEFINQTYINPEIRKVILEIEDNKEKDFANNLMNSLKLNATMNESSEMKTYMKRSLKVFKAIEKSYNKPEPKPNPRHV